MKKCLALILVLFMLIGSVSAVVAEENVYSSQSYTLLSMLDIAPKGMEGSLSDGITRGEVAQLLAKFMGSGNLVAQNTEFSDVTVENEFSGYINFLYAKGVVSLNDARLYYPDRFVTYEEAVKMAVCALGGETPANTNGGYPTGYLSVAASSKIIDGSQSKKFITFSDVCDILVKALEVPLFQENNFIVKEGDTSSQITVNKNDTALTYYLNITVLKANIVSEDVSNNSLNAKILSIGKSSADFEKTAGETVTLTLSENIESGNLRYIDAELWVKGTDLLMYVSPLKNTVVYWGGIAEVNKDKNEGMTFNIKYIENIAFYDSEEYIDVADNCRFFYNGTEVLSGGIVPNGKFARVILKNNEITSLEVWELNEGGVITDTSAGFVYSKGIETGIFFNQYDECKTITAIINNQFQSKFMFKKGMLFDWYYNEESGDLIIVSSGISKTDEFSGTKKSDGKVNSVIIGNEEFKVSTKYGISCKKDNDAYNTAELSELLGETVTLYTDYKGEARYMELFVPAMSENEFYGIVLGCKVNTSGLDDDELKIARITENGPEINEYKTKYKIDGRDSSEPLLFPAGVDIVQTIKDINSADNKNYEMKKAQVLFKFKLNNQGKIISVKLPTLFDACSEDGVSPTEISGSGSTYARISYKIFFKREIPLCAYYYDDGEIKIEVVKAGDIVGLSISDCVMHFYSNGDTSEIEFVLLRGNATSICDAAYEKASYEIMSSYTEAYNEKTQKSGYNLTIGGIDYFMTGDSVEGLPKRAIVKYGVKPLFGENEITLLDAIDISGNPSSWKIQTGSATGLHKGTVERFDELRLYTQDGRFYYDDNVIVYKMRSDGKLINAARNEITSGSAIYYYLGSVVEMIILAE